MKYFGLNEGLEHPPPPTPPLRSGSATELHLENLSKTLVWSFFTVLHAFCEKDAEMRLNSCIVSRGERG